MKVLNLNGKWQIFGGKYKAEGDIPGSVYSILLKDGQIPDPFYRNNEEEVLKVTDTEFKFTKKYDFKKKNKNRGAGAGDGNRGGANGNGNRGGNGGNGGENETGEKPRSDRKAEVFDSSSIFN